MYVFKTISKHSATLAKEVVKSGALETLVGCLEEFDTCCCCKSVMKSEHTRGTNSKNVSKSVRILRPFWEQI